MYKVSVIVPIYGVEKFIERCAESLMRQTLKEVEYVFVDDSTLDNSMAILQSVLNRYPHRKQDVKVIRHEHNKGLPAARNTGLTCASGEYIYHCDSDDYMEYDMLEEMYDAAIDNSADIVWCDWYLSFEKNERYMKQPSFSTPFEALKGMLGGAMKYNVWNKLVKRELYLDNQIFFPEGYGMGEDMTMIMLFTCSTKVAHVPQAFYHYVKLNTEAFSNKPKEINFESLKYNVERISCYLTDKYGNTLDKDIAFLKLEAKFPFLMMGKPYIYRWRDWYPEVNTYILDNTNVSLRSRMVQWLASKNLFFVVKFYFWLLYNVVYGLIYK